MKKMPITRYSLSDIEKALKEKKIDEETAINELKTHIFHLKLLKNRKKTHSSTLT